MTEDLEKAMIHTSFGDQIIIVTNVDTEEYYFSMDHIQPHPNYDPLPNRWVPCTVRIPHSVVPRPGLVDGIVDSVADYIFIYHNDGKRVPNPDPSYDPLLMTEEEKRNWRRKWPLPT